MNWPKQNEPPGNRPACPLEDHCSILQRLKIFRNAPLDMVRLCAYFAKKEEYRKDEPVILQGDHCSGLYVLLAGEVSLCEEHFGKSYHLQTLSGSSYDCFGEVALLTAFPAYFSVWARTEVSLLILSREAFRKVMEKFPQAYPHAVERISRLQIDRFIARTDQLILKTDQAVWSECQVPPHRAQPVPHAP